ncbi:HNH endonuclease, partial [Mycolicibacterium sp. 018/SC-01/001]
HGRHTATYHTPTGATYHSTAPPQPGPPPARRYSMVEGVLAIDLIRRDVA